MSLGQGIGFFDHMQDKFDKFQAGSVRLRTEDLSANGRTVTQPTLAAWVDRAGLGLSLCLCVCLSVGCRGRVGKEKPLHMTRYKLAQGG